MTKEEKGSVRGELVSNEWCVEKEAVQRRATCSYAESRNAPIRAIPPTGTPIFGERVASSSTQPERLLK
ncbi:hypothetical protein [Cohnella faecalis]|uniref:Uncharacterized protein n=1 Tax=Cohnella faecalis TaxID=2315694 RepID=A0A398CPT4_9BACL|nr:hypothetical protein [Cohnella faecalis]RIE04442.1 hypothetical protein D3H35_07610 [Cohnella faecalis]